jgi:hypothetical protein
MPASSSQRHRLIAELNVHCLNHLDAWMLAGLAGESPVLHALSCTTGGTSMYEIEMQEMSNGFFQCWKAAGVHLGNQVDGGIQSWLRAHPYPPFLEHLSFRLGNQLFFVRIEDADGRIQGPGSLSGLASVATAANGHACILPMKKLRSGAWAPQRPGWGRSLTRWRWSPRRRSR